MMTRIRFLTMALLAVVSMRLAEARQPLQVATCDRGGDADVLGLGVRLGMYFTTMALVLAACTFNSIKDLKQMVAASLPLLLALAAVVTRQVVAGVVSDFGFLASMYLVAMYWNAVMFPMSYYCYIAAKEKVKPGLTIFVACMLGLWLMILQLWFWTSGYARLQQPACGVTYVFMFTRVDAYGWFRTFAKVMLGLAFSSMGPMVIVAGIWACVGMWHKVKLMLHLDHADLVAIDEAEQQAVNFELFGRREYLWGVALFYEFPLVVGAVVAVELIINWNQMQGLYVIGGTGQTLAFVTGFMALFVSGSAALQDLLTHFGPSNLAAYPPFGVIPGNIPMRP